MLYRIRMIILIFFKKACRIGVGNLPFHMFSKKCAQSNLFAEKCPSGTSQSLIYCNFDVGNNGRRPAINSSCFQVTLWFETGWICFGKFGRSNWDCQTGSDSQTKVADDTGR